MEILNQKQIYVISTIRENKVAKSPFLNYKTIVRQGSIYEITNVENNITLKKLYGHKSMNICSNFIASKILHTIQSWNKKEKKYVSLERPKFVKLYNQSMGNIVKYDFID